MKKLKWCVGMLAVAVVLAVSYSAAQEKAAQAGKQVVAKGSGRQADEEAIRKQAREFVQAFAKADAKAIAASWTDQCEFHDESGDVVRGRAAIETEYAEFFKEHPRSWVDVQIESIRFLSRDAALEDGTLMMRFAGPELPSSTRYSVMHVREDGQWKIAFGKEWGAGDDKLQDLTWLIGNWAAKLKDHEVQMSFDWNEKKTQIRYRFSVREAGRVTASGTQTIAFDPQTGQLRSWVFGDDGDHGQSLWFRGSNRWVQDSVGVLPDGRETSATNVISRLSDDEFLWRSTDRTVDSNLVPDPDPIKISRVKSSQ